jgi:uncharacterized protein
MPSPQQPPPPIDLDGLSEYLLSDAAPPDCMDLSQLDGFLTGVVIGPEMVLPSEFLPVVWAGGEPDFASMAQAESVLGAILGRYNEIATGMAAEPAEYAPIFWQDEAGTTITEDWAVGFMQAVSLRSEAWEAALMDDDTAPLLVPIGIIAGMAAPEVGLRDIDLSDTFLDELMAQAPGLLPTCVLGLQAFWADRAAAGGTGGAGPLRH